MVMAKKMVVEVGFLWESKVEREERECERRNKVVGFVFFSQGHVRRMPGGSHVLHTLGGKKKSWVVSSNLGLSLFFSPKGLNSKMALWAKYESIRSNFHSRHFRHPFPHFLAFFQIYSKPIKQNKIKEKP